MFLQEICSDDATKCHHKTDMSLPRITILSLSLMAVAVLCVSFLAANLFWGSLKNLLLISTAHRFIDRREYGRMIDMST
uniref:Uncharacterized protein n=1 Tax=Romanomermis culicivorax TaxID=13658 RepID=A0A915IFT6_ROMCU